MPNAITPLSPSMERSPPAQLHRLLKAASDSLLERHPFPERRRAAGGRGGLPRWA